MEHTSSEQCYGHQGAMFRFESFQQRYQCDEVDNGMEKANVYYRKGVQSVH